jgi:transposase
LQDWVLDQPAVHVDETGWRTSGDGRALWGASTPDAVFLQIAEHWNREVFNALIGTEFPGIVISHRWNGYSHLDPQRRQACWPHLQRDFRRHADGLGAQKPFGERGLELTSRVFATWRAYHHDHHHRAELQAEIAPIQTELRAPLEDASPKKARNHWHRRSFANNLLKIWPALWTFTLIDGVEPTTTPPNAHSTHRSSTAKSRSAPKARPVSDSPNARYRPPAPADYNTAHCSPTSAT